MIEVLSIYTKMLKPLMTSSKLPYNYITSYKLTIVFSLLHPLPLKHGNITSVRVCNDREAFGSVLIFAQFAELIVQEHLQVQLLLIQRYTTTNASFSSWLSIVLLCHC